MDWDDIYMQAHDELEEELGREPNLDEIERRAQSLTENVMADAYDRAKDLMKYGE